MIRPAVQSDLPRLIELAASTRLFEGPQLTQLETVLLNYFKSPEGKGMWLASANLGVVGLAYCERERMTDGTWNLMLIAIAPQSQRQGYGSALLEHVETKLAESGAHQLLIETSANLTDSAAFYRTRGYQEEGRIRDFYEPGVDKVVFRRVLTAAFGRASASDSETFTKASKVAQAIEFSLMQRQHLDAVVQLLADQLEEHGIAVDSQNSTQVLKTINDDPRRGFIIVATNEEGSAVGVALCSSFIGVEHGGESGWLEELFVAPAYRMRGIGTRLLNEAIRVAREKSWTALDLEVVADHARVIELYDRHGFRLLNRSRMVLPLY